MNIKYLLILGAVYLAWQWISHLYESAKQKEQQRQRGQMQGRRPVGSGPSGAGPVVRRGTSTTPPSGWDDLASRRRDQLEQLRAGREARRTAQPVSVRTARPAPPTVAVPRGGPVPGRPVARPQARATPGVDAGDWFRQQQPRPTPPRRAPVVRRRPERAPAVRRVVEQPVDQPRSRVTEVEYGERARRARLAGRRAQRLLGRLQDVGSLQELFILKEVLDPPVGMRSPGAIGPP